MISINHLDLFIQTAQACLSLSLSLSEKNLEDLATLIRIIRRYYIYYCALVIIPND